MKNYKFHVHGMHCASCVLLTESKISSIPNVSKVKSNLNSHSVEVVGDFENMTPNEIAKILTESVEKYGYTVSPEKQVLEKKWSDFKFAIPFSLCFILLFIILQKLGIVNLVSGGDVTYGTAFVIGFVASLSTCMAVVGGLLLSMSATFAKDGRKIKPQIMFHLGRIVSFFILGGVIGAVGASFKLSTTFTFILDVIIAAVMLILGLNLLDIFPWAKKLQPRMPKFISKRAHNISNASFILTPLFVGVATFFLPCGFTQSMQLYTLTVGSFLKGGLLMLSFALGTLPILLIISFSSFSIKDNKKLSIFFKTVGLIVIFFAIFNFINLLVIVGIIPPIFNL